MRAWDYGSPRAVRGLCRCSFSMYSPVSVTSTSKIESSRTRQARTNSTLTSKLTMRLMTCWTSSKKLSILTLTRSFWRLIRKSRRSFSTIWRWCGSRPKSRPVIWALRTPLKIYLMRNRTARMVSPSWSLRTSASTSSLKWLNMSHSCLKKNSRGTQL